MDTIPLVNELVDDGGRLIQRLDEEGIPTIVACWVKPIEEDRWSLFIATPLVDERGAAQAYREVYRVLRSLGTSRLTDSDINLVGPNDPIARDALDIRGRFGGRLPTRSSRPQFGNLAVEETYIYPSPMSLRLTREVADETFGNLKSLPERIREVYMWLCQDVVSLNQKWDFYQGLFGKPENYAVFDLAPLAFKITAESLKNDLIMSISRLGDPAKTGDRANLSFATLLSFYENDDMLKGLLKRFHDSCAMLCPYRDKFIVHSDLNARLRSGDSLAPQPGSIDSAITLAEAILRHVAIHHGGTDIGFGKGTFASVSSGALIYWLRKAWDHHRTDVLSLVPP
jgi:hypothetical protein